MSVGERKSGDPSFRETEASLTKIFTYTVYSRYCRTWAYSLPQENGAPVQGWLEAFALPDQGWRICEVRQTGVSWAAPSERKVVESGLSFLKAMEKLAAFEASSGKPLPDDGRIPPEHHLRAFAMREGLVFDATGFPRMTAHGRIVTGGMYPASAAASARKAWNTLQGTYAGRLEESTICEPLHYVTLPMTREAAAHIDTVLAQLQKIKRDISSYDEGNAQFYVSAAQDKDVGAQKFAGEYRKTYEIARRLMNRAGDFYAGQPEADLMIDGPVRLFKLHIFLILAAQIETSIRNAVANDRSLDSSIYAASTVSLFLGKAKNILEECGYGFVSESIAFRILREHTRNFEEFHEKGDDTILEKSWAPLGAVLEELEKRKNRPAGPAP